MCFSNLALSYLNYPTQLIFKSCKLIPVMIGSIIIMQKKYGFLDYVAAIIMCIGLTMFTLGKIIIFRNLFISNIHFFQVPLLKYLCDFILVWDIPWE